MALTDATSTTGTPAALGSSARRATFVLPADVKAVGEARRRVLERLSSWGVTQDGCDTAVLVVSELFTNSVVHTASRTITCSLRATPDQLRIQVADDGSCQSAPMPQRAGVHDEEGRGLMLVKTVSRRWGAGPTEDGDGRAVWADLPTHLRA
ncbi:anti-sigma regulatory factor (Ser/Thr protein kinase) [Streptomyces aurantiacus]|uniref:ATP-binding protein n=1 Tax=Streptomyces aurantiacus TaxID=47760 RepID=UPI002793DE0F|nr:ATP-binding protein [Streptomyces aurantiacus]MDQ0772944.1 anti-sigma regulatory factor (Ser/Thr protein kinase) [Streptomyces aurantiacus]